MKSGRILTVVFIFVLSSFTAIAHKNQHGHDKAVLPGASFSAQLLRASEINAPATPLAISGTDPLRAGEVSITDKNHIQVKLEGATPNVTYDLIYLSLNGVDEQMLGSLTTNPAGNANLEIKNFFALGDTGAGTILVKRIGLNQFVSGFNASTATAHEDNSGEDEDEDDDGVENEDAAFRADLVRCAEVNKPVALANPGSDTLAQGDAELGRNGGSVTIRVRGAAASSSYAVVLRSSDASSEAAIGTLATDAHGNGDLSLSSFFSPTTKASGNIVLTRDGKDQFAGGFKIAKLEKSKGHKQHGR